MMRRSSRTATWRPLFLIIVTALLVLLASACGGDDEEGAAPEPAPAAPVDAPAEEPAAPAEEPAAEQVLRVNYGSEPPSLDPGLSVDVTSANVIAALFEGLVKLGEDLEPEPALAESWQVSEDGKTVTFTLRQDGQWTNSDPVTANDFEYAWKRVLDPETAADYAYQFYGIVGALELNSCEQECGPLMDGVGVRALDDYTLEVELTTPQPWFVQQIAHYSFLPVHQQTVEQFGDKWTEPENIVTNGPFRLTAWEHEASITLEKWEDWRDADSVALERVEGRMIADANTTLQAFEAREIDACVDTATCIPTADFDRLKGTADFVDAPALQTNYLGINVKNVTDVNQRRALALAVDRQVLIDNVLKNGAPATSFTPQGMPGFDVIAQGFLPESADLERAREFLDRAENPKTSLNVVTFNSEQSRQTLVAVQAMWSELGIKSAIKVQEWAQFLEFIGPPPNEALDVYFVGWIGDYVDAINFLELWTCESGNNNSNFCDPEYDQLIAEARGTADDEARYELYAQAEARLTGEEGAMPVVPLQWPTQPILRRPSVQGWEQNLLGLFDYTRVSIAAE